MQLKNVFYALALIGLTSTAFTDAKPVADQSHTTLQVTPTKITPYGDEKFSVTVQRVDDLVTNSGKIIAERIMDVKLNFDVKDNDILVNDVPISIGVSTIKIETDILVGPDAVKAGLTTKDVKPAFDLGLVKVQVHAAAEKVLIDVNDTNAANVDAVQTIKDKEMIEIRRVIIEARIIEINGFQVVQSEVVEQVLDIFPTGGIHRSHPKTRPHSMSMLSAFYRSNVFDVEDAARRAHTMPCHHGIRPIAQHANRAWHKLPRIARIAIMTFFGSFVFFAVFVGLPIAIGSYCRSRRDASYRSLKTVDDDDDDDDDQSFDFGADEKKLLESDPYEK